jgi:hypothetical protein
MTIRTCSSPIRWHCDPGSRATLVKDLRGLFCFHRHRSAIVQQGRLPMSWTMLKQPCGPDDRRFRSPTCASWRTRHDLLESFSSA